MKLFQGLNQFSGTSRHAGERLKKVSHRLKARADERPLWLRRAELCFDGCQLRLGLTSVLLSKTSLRQYFTKRINQFL